MLQELKQSKLQLKKKWNFSDPLTKPEKYTFYKVEKNKGISVYGHWFLFLHFHGKMFLWQKIRLLIKEQNRTENNEIVDSMNFSGIYKEQQFYRNHAEMQEDISWLEVQDLPGSNCYCDEEAQNRILDDIKNYTGNGIHFIDSGNYIM